MRFMIALLLGSGLLFGTGCVPRSTEANEVGVAINMLTGMDPSAYPPSGTYFFAPIVTDWYTFSTQAQTLTMLVEEGAGDREGRDDLEFKTRDGNDVAVDVTVIYRLIPSEAPKVLQSVGRSDQEIKELIMRPLARSLTRDVLNELSSEDVYAGKKFQAAERARNVLDAALKPYGLTCDNVMLSDHRFHERYQKAINDKKVFDQQVNTSKSATENLKREWEAKLEATKGEVERMIAAETGRAQQLQLEADAHYVSRQKAAEAILAEKRAKAEGVTKLNSALAGAGGRVMVKRKIASALKGKKIVLLPGGSEMGLQKLDVNELLKAYGVNEALQSKERPASKSSSSSP
ncbi:MAG: SPFH domain-containing protein [Myxococcota bacterium]